MKIWILGLGAALLAGECQAAPAFLPVRDVSVDYVLHVPGRPAETYTLDYDALDQRARVESSLGYYVLADLPAGSAQVVVPALHAVVQAPDFSGLTHLIYTADDARFTRLGHGDYAGLRCEEYLITNHQGSGHACITHDGVVLHFSGSDDRGSAAITAVSVAFGPLPPAEFAAPAGYQPITLPPGTLAALLQGR